MMREGKSVNIDYVYIGDKKNEKICSDMNMKHVSVLKLKNYLQTLWLHSMWSIPP